MEFSAEDMFGEDAQPKTLYVGNLNAQMTEEFLLVLFSQLGVVKGCKIIQEVVFLFGWILPCVLAGIFWNNGKPQLLRTRGRPTRHYNPTMMFNHHVNNRIYKAPPPPIVRHHRDPTQFPPIIHTYRPASPGGPMVLSTPAAGLKHQPQNPFGPPQHAPPGQYQHHHYTLDPPKFQSPVPNLVDTVVKVDGASQYGYLAPTYSGWKPIPKPHYGHPTSSTETVTFRTMPHTTEPYWLTTTSRKQSPILPTTLFREDVRHVRKPLTLSGIKLQSEYSENQGVTIPRPIHDLSSSTYRLPPTFSTERLPPSPASNTMTISEIPLAQKSTLQPKPFPKFQPRVPAQPSRNPNEPNSNSATRSTAAEFPQLVSKFKISRPKLKVKPHPSFSSNEPEIEGLGQETPKVTFSPANNGNLAATAGGVGSNGNGGKVHKVRSRVKVKARKPPEGFVNADQLSHVLAYRPQAGQQTLGVVKVQEPSHHHHNRHPSPSSQEGTESYDHSPPVYTTPFPFPADFMNGFGSDELYSPNPQRLVSRTPITLPDKNHPSSVPKPNRRPLQNLEPQPHHQQTRRKRPKPHRQQFTTTEPPPQVQQEHQSNDQSSIYPEDFYMPPGFTQNPVRGQNPVSFMTMPNSKPHVIHHTLHQPLPYPPHQHHEHLPSITFERPPSSDQYNNNHHQQQIYDGQHSSQKNAYQHFGHDQKQPYVFLNINNGQNQPHRPYHLPGFEGSASPHGGMGGRGRFFREELKSAQLPSSSLEANSVDLYSVNGKRGRPTTPRTQYRFPVQNSPVATSQGQANLHVSSMNFDGYGSNEYDRIPLEYLNDLRPILFEESQFPSSTSSSTRHEEKVRVGNVEVVNRQQISAGVQNSLDGSLKNSFQHHPLPPYSDTPTLAPPSPPPPPPGSMENHIPFESSEATQSAGGGFMDEFFRSQGLTVGRPFVPNWDESKGSSAGSSTNLYLVPQYVESSTKREGFDNYKAGSSIEPQVVNFFETTSSIPAPPAPKAIDHPPMISMSPIHEYSLVATISPIHDLDLSSGGPKWSKLRKDGESGASTEPYRNPGTNKYKKLDKYHDGSESRLVEEIKGISSTVRSSSTKKTLDEEGNGAPKGSYSEPSPLVLKNMTLDHLSEDDSSDSNTPKTRVLSQPQFKQTLKPILTTPTTTMETTMKRQFKRRRPASMLTRRNSVGRSTPAEGDLPVTTHHPKNYFGVESDGMGFESTRISLKSTRRSVWEGKAQPDVGSRMEVTGGKRTVTTPKSVDPNAVTYGESQWFQVATEERRDGKSVKVKDYKAGHGGDGGDEREDEGEISFSSRILSKTPHIKLESLHFDSDLSPVPLVKVKAGTEKWESRRRGRSWKKTENVQKSPNVPLSP